ncbi:MAG: hypothetical protein KGL39_24980 [Patescibacteria group bacterium]|nr:hypothetical protein [Patescibacteria group bacterium]
MTDAEMTADQVFRGLAILDGDLLHWNGPELHGFDSGFASVEDGGVYIGYDDLTDEWTRQIKKRRKHRKTNK